MTSIKSSDFHFLVPENLVQIGTLVSEKIQFEFLYVQYLGRRSKKMAAYFDVCAGYFFWALSRFSPWDFYLGDTCPPASVKWGTSDNFRRQNISAPAKIAFDFKSCMNTPFFKCIFNSSFSRALFCVYKNLVV